MGIINTELTFSTTELHWATIIIGFVVICITVNTVFLLRALKLERWQIRKVGHMILNTIIAFFPLFYTNAFDVFVTLLIALGFLLLLSAIPQIRVLQRIFKLCSREEDNPWELFINAVLMGITMLLIFWFFRTQLFVFTAAYLTVSLGDGLGEMIGRPYGKIKYKIFAEKSLEGSLGVLVGTCIGVVVGLAIGSLLLVPGAWWKIIVISLIGMIVEALSYIFLDNITLPASIAVSIYLLFLI